MKSFLYWAPRTLLLLSLGVILLIILQFFFSVAGIHIPVEWGPELPTIVAIILLIAPLWVLATRPSNLQPTLYFVIALFAAVLSVSFLTFQYVQFTLCPDNGEWFKDAGCKFDLLSLILLITYPTICVSFFRLLKKEQKLRT